MNIVKVKFEECPVRWEHEFIKSEFDWVAVDQDGCIGYFTSAGAGAIPVISLENAEALAIVDQLVHALPITCGSITRGVSDRDISEWRRIATKGVFAFDWRRESEGYELIAKPQIPARVGELGESRIQNLVVAVALPVRYSALDALKFYG